MFPRFVGMYLLGSVFSLIGSATAQVPGVVPGTVPANPGGYKIISPVTVPTLTPGQLTLLELEGRFSQAVAEGGG